MAGGACRPVPPFAGRLTAGRIAVATKGARMDRRETVLALVAKAPGIKGPQALMVRADEVIA